MTVNLAMSLVEDMLWTAMLVAGPVLGVALAVGLLVSIFQVVTQIQEMTLTMVPKIFAVVVVLFLLGQWMLLTLIEFSVRLYTNIPAYL